VQEAVVAVLDTVHRTVEDLHLDDAKPYVEFIRGKTRHVNKGAGITGHYLLWPETVKALKGWLAGHKPVAVTDVDGQVIHKVFTSDDGFPLVRYDAGDDGKQKVDSIRMAWERLLLSAGAEREGSGKVRWLSFKYLRKTTIILYIRF
jgi:hypothetical protein